MLNRLKKPIVSLVLAFCMLAGMMSFAFVSAIVPDSGVKVGDTVYEDVRVGDTVTYTVNLTAAEKFYGVDGEITYDSDKLTIVPKGTGESMASFKGGLVTLNTNKPGIVKFSAAGTSKYNFQTEKVLVTLDFIVNDTTYSEIDLSIVDMWIDGYGDDEKWYYRNYEPVITEGITITESLAVTNRPDVEPEPTADTTTAPATEATTLPVTESTEESATQETTATETTPAPEQDTPKKGIGVGGTVYYIADAGDRVVYTVNLKAEKLFENVEATIVYDSEKLTPAVLYENGIPVTDIFAEGKWMCPNLGKPFVNSSVDGIIKLYDIRSEGNDFREGKVLFEIEFLVKDSAYSKIELIMNEMTVKGGEEYYFSGGIAQITDGIEMNEELAFGSKPAVVPTPTQLAPDATESSATESTQESESLPTQEESSAQSSATEETEESATDRNEESETHTSETEQTEETSSQTTSTGAVGESTTNSSEPSKAEPDAVYLIGDANTDGMINVKDATQVQKAAASLVTLTEVQTLAADCDGNAQVNVRDATSIQKFVAGMDTGLPIGEEKSK